MPPSLIVILQSLILPHNGLLLELCILHEILEHLRTLGDSGVPTRRIDQFVELHSSFSDCLSRRRHALPEIAWVHILSEILLSGWGSRCCRLLVVSFDLLFCILCFLLSLSRHVLKLLLEVLFGLVKLIFQLGILWLSSSSPC